VLGYRFERGGGRWDGTQTQAIGKVGKSWNRPPYVRETSQIVVKGFGIFWFLFGVQVCSHRSFTRPYAGRVDIGE